MELILTLDVGTTSVKACLFDRQLRQTALTSREYALQTRGVCAEVEAQVYLDAAAQCILALPAEARAKVCAVALTTQGETLLCVDRQGKALRPASFCAWYRSVLRNFFPCSLLSVNSL